MLKRQYNDSILRETHDIEDVRSKLTHWITVVTLQRRRRKRKTLAVLEEWPVGGLAVKELLYSEVLISGQLVLLNRYLDMEGCDITIHDTINLVYKRFDMRGVMPVLRKADMTLAVWPRYRENVSRVRSGHPGPDTLSAEECVYENALFFKLLTVFVGLATLHDASSRHWVASEIKR